MGGIHISYDSVYYWKNFLGKDKRPDITPDAFIVNFAIINQSTGGSYYEWLSFQDIAALLGYIKYIALPSGYCSRLFGKIEGEVIICAETYDVIVELFKSSGEENAAELIDCLHKDYALLEEIDKENLKVENLGEFCNSFNQHLSYKDIVFSNIEVLNNIKEVGFNLISEYEEVGMIEQLEEDMGLTKEEIVEMFSNIYENKFMLRRVEEFLKSKMLL